MNNNDFWTPAIWSRINGQVGQDGSRQAGYRQPGALKEAMGLIRVAQQIFPTQVPGTDDPIPADTIKRNISGIPSGIPSAGETKAVAKITKSFQLTALHIKDRDLTMAMNQVMLAAQSLALAEDALFFQGKCAELTLTGADVTAAEDLGEGLLGTAAAAIPVELPSKNTGRQEVSVYGSATYAAVIKGISIFSKNAQARPFALILDPVTFADANIPLQDSSIVTPASAINALMGDGGYFTMSPSLPEYRGLLVSLGGKTTQLYIGTEPIVEFDFTEKGVFNFTAQESIQFHNIDPRSLIRLEFEDPCQSGTGETA